MKLIFSKAGRYKSGADTVVVSQEDVDKKIPVEIFDVNAIRFCDAGRAKRFKAVTVEPKPVKPAPKPKS